MSTAQTGPLACLSDDQIASYLAGDGGLANVVTRHISECRACRILVGEAARSIDTAPRPRSEAATLRPGELVDERYEVVRFIARGGMGEVYEARDRLLGEVVALKTLACTILESEVAIARMKQEMLIARRITHQNVCRLFDFSVHAHPGPWGTVQIPLLTMELLQGQTLGERLRERGPLSVAAARPLLLEMIAGLGAVHAAGIIHRDFKSDNVFLVTEPGGEERAVVMDLGLARSQDLHRSGVALTGDAVVGTLDYMSPEQLEGEPPHPGFDVYALGVVMFEMLTGQRPFAARTTIATALKRLRERPPLPSETVVGVEPALDAIVSRCLAKDRARRFATMDEVRRALERPATGRGPGRRLLIAAAVIAGAGGMAVAGLQVRNPRARSGVAAAAVPTPAIASEPPPIVVPPPVEPMVVGPPPPAIAPPPAAPARKRRRPSHPESVAVVEKTGAAVAPAPAVPDPPRAESSRKNLLLDF